MQDGVCALQKAYFPFPQHLSTVAADRTDCRESSSPPATSHINHFLSVADCGRVAPSCISLIPISLSRYPSSAKTEELKAGCKQRYVTGLPVSSVESA